MSHPDPTGRNLDRLDNVFKIGVATLGVIVVASCPITNMYAPSYETGKILSVEQRLSPGYDKRNYHIKFESAGSITEFDTGLEAVTCSDAQHCSTPPNELVRRLMEAQRSQNTVNLEISNDRFPLNWISTPTIDGLSYPAGTKRPSLNEVFK